MTPNNALEGTGGHRGRARHGGHQKSAADSAAHFLYIEKYEKHLLRWHFYFYRPHDSSQFNAVNFDDHIQGLVE